ncbi:hypothetical protein [Cytophaga aurantiaca]|uniref:hypothetical protein n=1 Tax=Cytophaga aurantiaca TaxID=29530 RepID=UPI0003796CA8|nr:hypothetical protein [Cytophaga aurantiaca]
MILLFIIAASMLQVISYYILDRYTIKIPSYIILIILLVGHLFIFPKFFYPEPNPNGADCGMPILGITLAFWLFGTIAAVLSHFLWIKVLK